MVAIVELVKMAVFFKWLDGLDRFDWFDLVKWLRICLYGLAGYVGCICL